jgi:hypothetical protein
MTEHRSRATASREAPPADPKELEAMARRAWRERGIAILWPDKIKDAGTASTSSTSPMTSTGRGD